MNEYEPLINELLNHRVAKRQDASATFGKARTIGAAVPEIGYPHPSSIFDRDFPGNKPSS